MRALKSVKGFLLGKKRIVFVPKDNANAPKI